ncbi:helix-hairpin-helix domain-containing protein, partial [Desulfobacterales bacterium HSG17]|nr:helix-hairpin-helix domain-containing protein [Desulfobacterales bacterium HSG17]
EILVSINNILLEMYGRQGWWPVTSKPGQAPVYSPGKEGDRVSDENAFEIITGAVLTQNTSWSNVEKAIINLSKKNLLDIVKISKCGSQLEQAVRPSGYYNQKAERLRTISKNIISLGSIKSLETYPTEQLRNLLLSWKGIGKETADSILCYAFNRPVFVVDTYTKRLFKALGLPFDAYDEIQNIVHQSILPSSAEYGDLHARIVKVSVLKESDKMLKILKSGSNEYQALKNKVLKNFQKIPGVGKKIALDFWDMGFRSIDEIKDYTPEFLYNRLNQCTGSKVDMCMLYVFRCAEYFVSNKSHDSDLLKWWNWKDK